MKRNFFALGLLAICCAIPAFAEQARLLRVTMKDGSEKLFLIEQITKITVVASSLDTEGLPQSSSSVSSSSVKTEVSSSSAKTEVSSSSTKTETSSSSVKTEVSSSSTKTETSSSSVKTEVSSSSAKTEASSSSKKTETSSSSAKTEVSSSSAKTEASSSSKKTETSSSSKKAEVSSSSKKSETSSSSKKSEASSSSKKSEASSSSKKKETSSSSKSKDAIIAMNPRNLRATWNAQQQAVLLYSNQSTTAKIFIFDAQGVRIANINKSIAQGTNSIPLAPLNLANGKYVLLVEANHTHTKNIITIDNASK